MERPQNCSWIDILACRYISVLSLSVLLRLISTIPSIGAFPSGAPLSACSGLMPVHVNGALMESPSPYLVLFNDTEYSSQPLKLTITTIGPGAKDFVAFMLQGRSECGQPIGRFSQVGLPVVSKTITCYGEDDTLTHAAAFIRTDMEVIWHPPSKNIGTVTITGSVALTKDNFWSVHSEPLPGKGRLDLSALYATHSIIDSNNYNYNAASYLEGSLLWIVFIIIKVIL